MTAPKNHKYPNPLAYIAMAILAAVVAVFVVIGLATIFSSSARAAESCFSKGVTAVALCPQR